MYPTPTMDRHYAIFNALLQSNGTLQRVLQTASPANHSNAEGSLVPFPDYTTFVHSSATMFDSQLDDRFNFGLHEDAVGVLSSLITGLTMIVLLDLFYRLIVRAQRGTVSTHIMFRRALFAKTLEPMCWITERDTPPQSNTAEVASGLENPDHAETRKFPRWQKTIVRFAALLLLSLDLLLIFLSTNRTSEPQLDLTKMPTLTLVQRRTRVREVSPIDTCISYPMTSRHGFASQATTSVCLDLQLPNGTYKRPYNGLAYVGMAFVNSTVTVSVNSHEGFLQFMPTTTVTLQNQSQYTVRIAMNFNKTKRIFIDLLELWGFPIYLSHDIYTNADSWGSIHAIDIRKYDMSREIDIGVNSLSNLLGPIDTRIWSILLQAVLLGSFDLQLSQPAYSINPKYGPFLHDTRGASDLVVQTRPFLSLTGCVITFATILFVWIIVRAVFKWHTGVDERTAWVSHFCSVQCVRDFEYKDEEFINV